MEIKNLQIHDVKPYFRNPRINGKTIKALKKSIELYGFNVPVVVDENYVLVTGHARYTAMLEMGKQVIPAYILVASNKVIKEYRIKDNRIHELTEWNEEELIDELTRVPTMILAIDEFDGLIDETLTGFVERDIVEPTGLPSKEPLPDRVNSKPISLIECPHCGEFREK
jgi:ParB-like chromosome segregation protein Spo0J